MLIVTQFQLLYTGVGGNGVHGVSAVPRVVEEFTTVTDTVTLLCKCMKLDQLR